MPSETGIPDVGTRRVFGSWSVAVPPAFEEAFIEDGGGYWQAWDEHRSVSLSSFVVNDDGGPVPADELAEQVSPLEGEPIDVVPPGLTGRASEADTESPAIASRALSGVLCAHGRVLLVTITADDRAWVRETWLSIRRHQPE